MIFQSTITNDQTAELPSAHFDGRIVVVDREEQIEAACRDLASHRIIGFDTETRPSFKAGVAPAVIHSDTLLPHSLVSHEVA